MSKIIMYANKLLVKVTGHKYTSTTVKLPFINISFAPAQTTAPNEDHSTAGRLPEVAP